MQSESLSTVRVRLLLKADDVGLEPLVHHLHSLPTSVERSNFVRSLLIAPVVIERGLLEVLRHTSTDGKLDGTLPVEISISQRDAGLMDVLRELNAISGLSNRRLYIKRRLVFLFAVHGVSPSATLLLQYANPTMCQAVMPNAAATQAISPVNPPSPLEEAPTTTSSPILHSPIQPIQIEPTKAPVQHAAPLPRFNADDGVMDFSPVKSENEDHAKAQKLLSKDIKSRKFKENAIFFGNMKK